MISSGLLLAIESTRSTSSIEKVAKMISLLTKSMKGAYGIGKMVPKSCPGKIFVGANS